MLSGVKDNCKTNLFNYFENPLTLTITLSIIEIVLNIYA